MNVGDYVRTDTGIIQKIDKIYEQNDTNDTHIQLNKMGAGKSVFILDNGKELLYSKGEVIKSSPNIIDLIEVGDYVNGVLINIKDDKGVYHGAYDSKDEVHITKVEDIKSIVTYEQFKSMEYKVGE